MNVKYFKDTDTALFEFSERPVEETRAISDNVSVDLDADGNLVSMTIEHAGQMGELPRVNVQEMGAA
ncbi:MAG TPA: DUF2283 domain-containing protein [Gemmatimonadales bacterium]